MRSSANRQPKRPAKRTAMSVRARAAAARVRRASPAERIAILKRAGLLKRGSKRA